MFKLMLLSLLFSFSISVSAEGYYDNSNKSEFIGSESIDTIQFDVKKDEKWRKDVRKNIFHEWRVECKLRGVYNDRHCSMKRYFLEHNPDFSFVSVELDSVLGLNVRFAYPDSPRVSGWIKIGKNKKEHFNEFIISGEQAEKILSQLQSEKYATIQTHKWNKPVVRYTADLNGFNEAYAEMLRQYTTD